jgi:hypothetical protein
LGVQREDLDREMKKKASGKKVSMNEEKKYWRTKPD